MLIYGHNWNDIDYASSILEDTDQKRAEFKFDAGPVGDLLKQTDVFCHQIHGEGNVTTAIQNDLAEEDLLSNKIYYFSVLM